MINVMKRLAELDAVNPNVVKESRINLSKLTNRELVNYVKENIDPHDKSLIQKFISGEIDRNTLISELESAAHTDHSMRQGETGMQGDDTPAGNRAWGRENPQDWNDDSEDDDMFQEGVTMEQMSMDSLRLLAGMTNKLKEHGIQTANPYGKTTLKECGPTGMMGMDMDKPSTPASISVTAGSGDELGNMLKTIMSLAGVKPVTQNDMPVDHGASAPMPPQMGGEPDMKGLIDIVTDEPESEFDTMNDIEDDGDEEVMPSGTEGDEEEEDEGYDNTPHPNMKQDGVRQFGDVDNNFQNSQVGRNVKQTTAESLYADLQKFMTEAAPDKKDIPAWKRKEKGGDWKVSKKDLEKEKDSRISDPKTLAKNSGKKVGESLGDEFAAMAKGMKNKDGTPRFTNVRQGKAPVKPASTKPARRPASSGNGPTSPADWYDQSSGGKRYTGD